MLSLKRGIRSLIIGLFFILPILLLLVLAAKFIGFLTPISSKLVAFFNLNSIFGQATVLIVTILLFIGLCVLCGYFLQKGIFKKWSNTMEEQLFVHFPSLQVLKYRMVENKADVINEFWQAVLFEEEGNFNIAFITEESENYFTLYIPDAPKIDAGEVRYVAKINFKHYPVTMQQAMSALYNFGKGLNIEEIMKH